jgi:hypothetical protein
VPDVTVHRHADRWAVEETGAESPIKEFPTREAAELAAAQMAGDGTVKVLDEDPTGLDTTPTEAAPGETEPKITAGDPAERSRQPQTGL